MKLKILFFAVLQAFAHMAGTSELTLREFESKINDGEFIQEDSDLVIDAFKNQDIEKVLVCFKSNQEAYAALIRPFNYCPKGDFKNELVIRILNEPWLEDSAAGGPSGISRGARYLMVKGICLSVIHDYLPSEVPSPPNRENYTQLSTHAGRVALAQRFRAALATAGKNSGTTSESIREADTRAQDLPPRGGEGSQTTSSLTVDVYKDKSGLAVSKLTRLVLIGVTAIVCLSLWLRKRKLRN